MRILQDFRTAVIEDPAEVRRFVDELQTSQTLYVRIRSLNAGRTAVEFKVEDADAVRSAYAECPLKPVPQPAPPRRRR